MTTDASQQIATALADAGADTVFGLPGGGNNLDLIGAVEDAGMRFVLAHAETPAAIMAGVHADLSGTPSACVVTRGPGAASAVNGVANALLDRQPLVLVTDAVSEKDRERIAHQRLDQCALLGQVTRWSGTIGSGDAAGTARHAVRTAMQHPRGPVHLDFDPTTDSTPPPASVDPQEPDDADLDRLAELVAGSQRPVLLLGGGTRTHVDAVRRLVADARVPVLTSYRAKGVVPDEDSHHAGMLTGATTEAPVLQQADLIVTVGLDTVELIPAAWAYDAPVVSIAEWPETSAYLRAEVEVVGNLEKLLGELAQHWPHRTTWSPTFAAEHRRAELDRMLAVPGDGHGIVPQAVVRHTQNSAPEGTAVTVDAGAHMLPAMSLWSATKPDEVLISSGLATMGFALPAAIGAALARPSRRVVCFTGDGGLGMCLGELETLVRYGLPVTVVLFDDARLSLIAIKAMPEGNGGENAIRYGGVDFATVARGYGLLAASAATEAELDVALAAAFASPGPSLIDIRVDPTGYADILAAVRGTRTHLSKEHS